MCSWGLSDVKVEVLGIIDSYVNDLCTCAPATGGILLYPGSGVDIANALFASASRIDTFVFVDNWQGGGADQTFDEIVTAFQAKFPGEAHPERFAEEGVRKFAESIHVVSACPMLAFSFMFRGRIRYLLFLRTSLEVFFTENGGFRCHVIFVKDLGGTTSDVTCAMALPYLHLHGLFVTNQTLLHVQLFGLRRLISLIGIGYGDTIVLHKVRAHSAGYLHTTSDFVASLKSTAASFFAELDDDYDFLSRNYGAVQPHEVNILAQGMTRIKARLVPLGLMPDEQFEICKAVIQESTWVTQWDHDIPAYLAAWQLMNMRIHMQRVTDMLKSRPRAPGRKRAILPRFQG